MADFFEQLGKKISDVADLEYISLCESIEKKRGRSSTVPGGDTKNSGGIADVIDGSRRTSCCAVVRGHGH